MMESLYGNGLVLLGLWVGMSLVMLFIWGLLAWAVVNILSRRRFRRTWAAATGYRKSHHFHQAVGDDSRRCSGQAKTVLGMDIIPRVAAWHRTLLVWTYDEHGGDSARSTDQTVGAGTRVHGSGLLFSRRFLRNE